MKLPPARFHGWTVVAGCFVMATIAWGLGFYGTGLFLAFLVGEQGMPIAAVSGGITAYFWVSAVLIMSCGPIIDRLGPRLSVTIGTVCLMLSVAAIARVSALWQFYAALGVLAVAWTTMSSSAINAILAPWFDRKRGLALSVALTGASVGGMVVIPLVTALSASLGHRDGLTLSAGLLGAVLLVVAWFCFVRDPAALGQYADGAAMPVTASPEATATATALLQPWPLARILRSRAFLSNALPFSIGLTVQIGFLTHQISMLQPLLGRERTAWAVGVTTVSAVLGRLVAGVLMDRMPRRAVAALNFTCQCGGLLLLIFAREPLAVYAACVLCGMAVGNMITFPGLLIQREFPAAQFNRVNRLAVGFGQILYACGPVVMGYFRQSTGSYTVPLWGCVMLAAAAAISIWVARPPLVTGTVGA